MQTKELDLLDMLVEVLTHWRGLIGAILIGAILMGAIGYANSYRVMQSEQPQENVTLDETVVKEQLTVVENKLDDMKKAVVLETINKEKEYELKKTYFESSIYMHLNSLQVIQTELVYQIQGEKESRNEQFGILYESLLDNVGFYGWLAQQNGIEENCMRELISVDFMPQMVHQNETQEVLIGTNCIKITILQADSEVSQKLSDAVKEYIFEQQKRLVNEIGEHAVVLVSDTTGVAMNRKMMEDQIECENDIATLQTTIATSKAGFTEDQRQYYELLTWEETEQKTQPIQQSTLEENIMPIPIVNKKYVLLGAVLFAFIYVLILCISYIFNTKIRVSDELQKLYGIPQMGVIINESRKKNFLDRWVDSLRHYGKRKFTSEQSMELAFVAVKIAVIKEGLKNICLIGCNMSAGADRVCESLKTALEKEQIKVTVLDNVLYDAETMEQLNAMQGAVLVEKAGSTLYNEITRELELLKRQEITMLGGVIVE